MFYAREKELNLFKKFYDEDGFCGLVVYGRRRQGKSTLILESQKYSDGKFVYYQCLNALDNINSNGLISVLTHVFPNTVISENSSFCEVLEYIFSLSINNKIVLVLDEFPFLKDLDLICSFIQSLIQKYGDNSNMKLIISGSHANTMLKLVGVKSPLFGRFKYKLFVKPFDYLDASNFYKNCTDEEKIAYYSVFGGTPYYLSMIDPKKTFEENIFDLLLSENAPLINEINGTMKDEYTKIENASYLMKLITSGKHSYRDINANYSLNAKNSDLAYLLNVLVEIGFLSKTYSINDTTKKHAYYNLSDNLFSFYFTLIYPNLAIKNVVPIDVFYDTKIKNNLFNKYIPLKFENICKEYLIRKNLSGDMNPFFEEIGSFSYNNKKTHINGQYDIVTKDKNGYVFYECKYTNSPVDSHIEKELIDSLAQNNIEYYNLGFFSKNSFENLSDKNYRLYDLDDLFFKNSNKTNK